LNKKSHSFTLSSSEKPQKAKKVSMTKSKGKEEGPKKKEMKLPKSKQEVFSLFPLSVTNQILRVRFLPAYTYVKNNEFHQFRFVFRVAVQLLEPHYHPDIPGF